MVTTICRYFRCGASKLIWILLSESLLKESKNFKSSGLFAFVCVNVGTYGVASSPVRYFVKQQGVERESGCGHPLNR
jgi:hypothetical protein